jgi:hypothetical protein
LASVLDEISEITGFKQDDLKSLVQACANKTEKLLLSYGADVLIQYLHPNAGKMPLAIEPEAPPPSDEALQLQVLRELTFLTTEKTDFNVVIQTALEGIYRGIGMDRVIVLLKSANKNTIEPLFISGHDSEQLKEQFTLNIKTMETVFS